MSKIFSNEHIKSEIFALSMDDDDEHQNDRICQIISRLNVRRNLKLFDILQIFACHENNALYMNMAWPQDSRIQCVLHLNTDKPVISFIDENDMYSTNAIYSKKTYDQIKIKGTFDVTGNFTMNIKAVNTKDGWHLITELRCPSLGPFGESEYYYVLIPDRPLIGAWICSSDDDKKSFRLKKKRRGLRRLIPF